MPIGPKIDLTGERFERLTVIGLAFPQVGRGTQWECRCDCGTTRLLRTGELRAGRYKSCGCHRTEELSEKLRALGMTREQYWGLYKIWQMMLSRCENPKHTAYPHYGAKGTRVCEAWHSFQQFLADMGPRPSPKHSLDRINNEGHYEPGNVRWATRREQANNRALTRMLTLRGVTKSVADWADQFSLRYDLVLQRLNRGWGPERCLGFPTDDQLQRAS